MLVAVVFLATSSLTYCLLNSYKEFAKPAIGDLVLKGTILLAAVALAGAMGPAALAAGFILGAIAKLAIHARFLGKHATHYRASVDLRDPSLRRFWLLAWPLLLGVSFSIARQVMDNRFTSSLPEGSLASIKFARTLCDTPVNLFPFMFGIALFPFLFDVAAAGDRDRLREMLMTATRLMVLIFVPLGALIFLLRDPIVLTVFGENSMKTTLPLQVYAAYMLVGALEIIVLQFFFAMSDTMRPTIVGILIVPLHVAVAYLGVYDWKWGAIAIAAALLISKGTKVIVLYALMRRRLSSLEGRRTLLFVGKVLLALLPVIAILVAATLFLPAPAAQEEKLAKILAVLPFMVASGVAMVLYVLMLHWLRTEEVAMLLARVRGRLGRTRA
jgi:putative peptidoglycan lipid II flippase